MLLMKALTWIFVLICLVSTPCVAAETLEIYVRNKPLQGEIVQKGDEIYVSAPELQKLVREKIEWDNAGGTVSIDGQPTSIRLMQGRSGNLVPLKALAKCTGYDVSYNRSTGILDVFKKTSLKKDAVSLSTGPIAAASAPAGPEGGKKDLLTIQGAGVSAVVADAPDLNKISNPPGQGNPGNSPVPGGPGSPSGPGSPGNQPMTGSPESSHMVYSPGAGYHTSTTSTETDQGLRITAIVTNGRPTEARNVVATCILKTQDGAVFTQQDQLVGPMKARGTSEVLFYFPAAGGGINLQRIFTVRGD
jgi:hypothetical protein